MKSNIPSNWNEKSIEDVADYVDYRGKTPQKVESGVFLITARNIKDGRIDYKASMEYISKEDYDEVMRRGIPKVGDVLITTEAPLGNVAQIDDANIALAQRIIKYRGKLNILDNDYLKFYLSSDIFQSELIKKSTGSTVKGIKGTVLHKMKIIFPPLKEQEKIAEILSTWDSAIEKQEQLIEKKKEFKKGLMQNLYSKGTKKEMLVKSKLGEVPESWKIVKAKEVFKSVSIKNNENEELLSVTQDKGTIPRSQLEGNVVMPEGSTRGYKLVVPNNFIISLRSFQGGLEISKHRGIISPAYTVLENKIEICHDYFKYYFKKEEFINRLNGAIVGIRDGKQISYADFGEMFLPVPSLEEQIKIAEILMVADKEIELLEKELEALKLQKKGLMQGLLTGEVRVKV